MKTYTKIESMRNDLYCEVGKCKCIPESFIGSSIEHLMKQTIKLSGYNDSYFFNEVNKDFREFECKKCGVKFDFKWTGSGVIVKNDNREEK